MGMHLIQWVIEGNIMGMHLLHSGTEEDIMEMHLIQWIMEGNIMGMHLEQRRTSWVLLCTQWVRG